MRHHPGLFAAIGLIAVLAVPAFAAAPAVFDHSPPRKSGETYGVAEFRLAIPAGMTQVRGILFRVAPHLSDSRGEVSDPSLLALCADADFALMGARLDDVGMETGIGDALLRTLAVFADASGHTELEFSALYCEGYSWGGQFAYHFTVWRPERVIGLVTMKGGYHRTDPAGAAIQVPAYFFIGEHDAQYRIDNLTGIFEAHRPLGARWILAMQPNAAHEPVTDRGLLDPYFDAAITRRLPDVIPPDRVPDLIDIPEQSGWLGDRRRQFIGAWDCYDAGPDSACWFAERGIGEQWQEFVSAGAAADTIACLTGAPEWTPASVRLLPSRPNPFNPATTLAYELGAAGVVDLRIFDLRGRLVRSLVTGTSMPAGLHESTWDGRDAGGRSLPTGSYVCRLQVGNAVASSRLTLLK